MIIVWGLLQNILEEGLIYGFMAMGVYITYKILDFPDLSVDSTFPMGACVTAVLIRAGVNPWLAMLLALASGMAAGALTGVLHVKLKITDLLSGILVMTALISVNLVITGGTSVLAYYNMPTIFNSGIINYLPDGLRPYRVLLLLTVLAIGVKLALDGYLTTRSGLLLRAAGDNPQFVTALGKNPGNRKILGLAIGNGCTAFAGSILSQQAESANINMGLGMVVMGLASVIIGTSIFRRLRWMRATTMAILGAILYKFSLSVAMQLGLPTTYLKLLMAVILTVALVTNRVTLKGGKKTHG
ncbi:MAG: ABC transporter permease [Christensenellales bacterium]|jgi:putative ABC transport system permease protein